MARDIAKTEAYVTSRHERKKIEMLFAHRKHLEARSATITRAEPSARRIPPCRHCPEPQETRQAHPDARTKSGVRESPPARHLATIKNPAFAADFFNEIGALRSFLLASSSPVAKAEGTDPKRSYSNYDCDWVGEGSTDFEVLGAIA
jgi:hypothetical protein